MDYNINRENFVEIFIKEFVPDIPKKTLKKFNCYPPDHGYLWMICEHDFVKCLKGKEAMNAYDNIDKTGAIEFQYDNGFMGDNSAVLLSEENDTSLKIASNGLYEFYVIGKDFSWCYIVTHERKECGPYFIKNYK